MKRALHLEACMESVQEDSLPEEDVLQVQNKRCKILEDELFVFRLAQDLMLDSVLVPLLKPQKVKRNLPTKLWNHFCSKPSFSFFQTLAELTMDTDLLTHFMAVYPMFLEDLAKLVTLDSHRMLFMTHVFWMIHSLFLEKELQFYWRSDLGFGVKTGISLAKGTLIKACWAEKVEVSLEKVPYLKSSGTVVLSVCDKGTQKQRHFALFGPLAFMSQACKICCNIVFQNVPLEQDTRTSLFPPPVEVTEELFTCCYARQDLRAGQELMYLHLGRCTSSRHTALHTAPSISL